MAFVWHFATDLFQAIDEPENHANQIRGHAAAAWFRSKLAGCLDAASEIDYEDWGWYLDVVSNKQSYMLGFCIHDSEQGEAEEVVVQIHKSRKIIEKLMGKNKLTTGDPLAGELRELIYREFSNVDETQS